MTINRSQGQTLNNIGIYLPKPVFCHGYLYVVVSRTTSIKGLKILIHDNEKKQSNNTHNIVYKQYRALSFFFFLPLCSEDDF